MANTYQGVPLPYQMIKSFSLFYKNANGPLYVLIDRPHPAGAIDKLFKSNETLGSLVKEFGTDAKLSSVLAILFKGRRRLADSKEIIYYKKLVERRQKYVDTYRLQKDAAKKRALARDLEKATKLLAANGLSVTEIRNEKSESKEQHGS